MLSLILPTYNEAENLPDLLEEIDKVLENVPYEVIIVDDDSPDRTWEVAQLLAEKWPYLRVLRRTGRRGLAAAVVEGFAIAGGGVLAVMDADRQHDSSLLPQLYAAIQNGADIAVASRYTEGGGTGVWMRARRLESALATLCVRFVCGVSVRDPLSGFFALKRELFRCVASSLRPRGFKILLEILMHLSQETKIAELPYQFRLRTAGQSKLTYRVRVQFFLQLFSLTLWRVWRALKKMQHWVFLSIALVIFFSLFPRVWALRMLYMNAELRQSVQQALSSRVEKEGWFLSDVFLQEVSSNRVRFFHHQHRKGADPIDCLVLFPTDSSIIPCNT